MAAVSSDQLALQKMKINPAKEAIVLLQTQRLARLFVGKSKLSPEGLNFKARAVQQGCKQDAQEPDQGLFGWTQNKPA